MVRRSFSRTQNHTQKPFVWLSSKEQPIGVGPLREHKVKRPQTPSVCNNRRSCSVSRLAEHSPTRSNGRVNRLLQKLSDSTPVRRSREESRRTGSMKTRGVKF